MLGRYFVYILASQRNGTLYIGVTNDLLRRLDQHRRGTATAFTARYHVFRLVYFEEYQWIDQAIEREKQLKGWNREWKLKLIERDNPDWLDQSDSVPY